jgi:hypothetical protein
MQTNFDLISTRPSALTVLAALCLYEEKCANLAQLENRLTLDTEEIEDVLNYLIEHEYIINRNSIFHMMQKGIDYVNQQTYSDFKLR